MTRQADAAVDTAVETATETAGRVQDELEAAKPEPVKEPHPLIAALREHSR